MASKLAAAKIAVWSGVEAVIADAARPGVLAEVSGSPGGRDPLPTPGAAPGARKLWIASPSGRRGRSLVDAGARRALIERGLTAPGRGGVRAGRLRDRRCRGDRRSRRQRLRQGPGASIFGRHGGIVGRPAVGPAARGRVARGGPIAMTWCHRLAASGPDHRPAPHPGPRTARRGPANYADTVPPQPADTDSRARSTRRTASRRNWPGPPRPPGTRPCTDRGRSPGAAGRPDHRGERHRRAAGRRLPGRTRLARPTAPRPCPTRLDGRRLRGVATLADPVGEVVDGGSGPTASVEAGPGALGVVGISTRNLAQRHQRCPGLCLNPPTRCSCVGRPRHRLEQGDRRGPPGRPGQGRPGLRWRHRPSDTSRVGRRVHAAAADGVIDCLIPGVASPFGLRPGATPPSPTWSTAPATATCTWTATPTLSMAEAIVVNAKTGRPGCATARRPCWSTRRGRASSAVAAAMPESTCWAIPPPGAPPDAGVATDEDSPPSPRLTMSVAVVDDLERPGTTSPIQFGSLRGDRDRRPGHANRHRRGRRGRRARQRVDPVRRWRELGLGAEIGIRRRSSTPGDRWASVS